MFFMLKRDGQLKASITIEAALVLPIFIYAMIGFLYFFQMIQVYGRIQYALSEMGREASKFAYIYEEIFLNKENTEEEDKEESGKEESKGEYNEEQDENKNGQQEKSYNRGTDIKENRDVTEGSSDKTRDFNIIQELIEGSYFKLKLHDYLKEEELDKSCIKGGVNGIHTYLSDFMKDEKTIDIIAEYKIKVPVLFFNIGEMDVIQRVHVRGFTGWKEDGGTDEEREGNEEELVYVTKFGTVYHKNLTCTHLKLSISLIPYEQVASERNEAGGKYSRCHTCVKEDSEVKGREVYIAKTGDRYHLTLNCSGLKRLVNQIPISQIEGRTPCKRCYKESKE